jgi:DNA-directed RNA polymerase specialized sigma24 family protein
MQEQPPTIDSSSRDTAPGSTLSGRLKLSGRRLRQLARKLLHRYPPVAGRDSLDNLLHEAVQQLQIALSDARLTALAEHIELAGRLMRTELAKLPRQFHAGGRASTQEAVPRHTHSDKEPEDATAGPETDRCARWLAFHAAVGQLPPDERQVFEFMWYHEIALAETAAALGSNEATVMRRWQAARLHLFDLLQGQLPAEE